MAWTPGEELILTKAVKENIGWIRGAVRAGLGPTKSYEILKSIGTAGRKQSFLDAYRAMEYAYQDASVYLPIDYSQRPNPNFIPLSPIQQRKAYHVDINVTFYNSLNNILEERPVTIMMDSLIPVGEMIEWANELVESYDEYESVQKDLSYIDRINFSNNPVSGII